MKRKFIISTLILTVVLGGVLCFCGSSGNNPSTILNDLYVYQSPVTAANMVFIANTQGPLTPAQTVTAQFDPNNIIQFNIDNNGDGIEDVIFQAVYKTDGYMYIYGPSKPKLTGIKSMLQDSLFQVRAQISAYGYPAVGAGNGITAFAGPRENPFYFDLVQFNKIQAGSATAFNTTGTDYYAGSNVMSVVLDIPKSMLGIPPGGKINVWATIKVKE